MLSGLVGICLNLLLFGGKLAAALLSGSVAIIADALNNLSDAFSAVVTIAGFKLSGKKADPEHPYGHGRFEYIAGFVVSIAILLMGLELAKSAIEGIFSPRELRFDGLTAGILAASIVVKLYMALYNRKLAALLGSCALKAVFQDSLSDVAATSAVLLSLVISHYTALNLDSWAGLLVSLFILYSGVMSVRDTIAPLLGKPPSRELVDSIERIVLTHEGIVGMHDLVVHDYGPGRLMLSLHAEVSAEIGVFESHALADALENELGEALCCEALIHVDPVDTNDESLSFLRETVEGVVRAVDSSLALHDFRVVPCDTHTNLIFDLVVQYGCSKCDEELKREISDRVLKLLPNYFCVIKCDRPLLG
jgi:cation diffusion facilitator family transporter